MKTAVQQIMLGKAIKDHDSALRVLKVISETGYDGIELNRFMIHPTSLLVRMLTSLAGMPSGNGGRLDWVSLIEESGLEIISLHSDLNSLEKEFDQHLEEVRQFRTDTIVITGMYRFDYSDINQIEELAGRLNEAGRKLKEKGVSLLYHNHNAELQKVDENICAYDLLIEKTDPEYVNFEFDSYWFTEAGADAEGWMKKLGRRLKMWHINDRGPVTGKKFMTPIVTCDSRELGQGTMDLESLYEAALQSDVSTVVLESHRNWIDDDPVKSLKLSYEWLKKHRKGNL